MRASGAGVGPWVVLAVTGAVLLFVVAPAAELWVLWATGTGESCLDRPGDPAACAVYDLPCWIAALAVACFAGAALRVGATTVFRGGS